MNKQEAIDRLKELARENDKEYAHDHADMVLCKFLKSLGHDDVVDAFKKNTKWISKDEVDYHEAYTLLEDDANIEHNGSDCFISNGLICMRDGCAVPLHSTFHNVYVVNDFKPLGLHQDIVQIEVHGVTVYQHKNTKCVYRVDDNGHLFCDKNNTPISRIKYKGDAPLLGCVIVIIDSEGNVLTF